MTRPVLRWWLFVCLTAVAIVLAGLLGFWRLVWAHDVSYLGTGLLVAYIATTAWIGWKVHVEDRDMSWPEFIARKMPLVGVIGTFIGIYTAFTILPQMVGGGEKAEIAKLLFFDAVATKLFTSIIGSVFYIAIETQIKILGGYDEEK